MSMLQSVLRLKEIQRMKKLEEVARARAEL
jgi:hypothetical protein